MERLTNAVDVVRGNAVKNAKKVTAVSKRVDVLEVRQVPNMVDYHFIEQLQWSMKTRQTLGSNSDLCVKFIRKHIRAFLNYDHTSVTVRADKGSG